MSWLFFAALGQIFWSLGNIIDKLLLNWLAEDEEDSGDSVTQLLLFSGLAGIIVSLAILFWDYSAISTQPFVIAILAFNGICTLLWLWLYLKAAEHEEISVIVPIFQLVPVAGLGFGYWFLGETVIPEKLVAGGLVIFGAILLTLSRDFFKSSFKTLGLMALASVFVASTDLLFKLGGTNSNFLTAVFWTYLSMAAGCLLLLMLSTSIRTRFVQILRTRFVKVLSANIGNETIDVLGNTLFAFALLFAPIAIVQTTNSFQPVIVFILTLLMTIASFTTFKEHISWGRMLQKGIAITIITTAGWHLYFL